MIVDFGDCGYDSRNEAIEEGIEKEKVDRSVKLKIAMPSKM